MLALLMVLVAQRQTQNFDHAWRFHLGDVAGAQETAFDDAAWRALDLPHDWSIEGEFSEQNPDGVYRNSDVWINGRYLGKRPYGYSSFRYELTPQLRYGTERNVIAVRVDNSQQPNSRWYSGSGIYRHVRLVTTDPVHVDQWGTYITTPAVSAESSRVTILTSVRNEGHGGQRVVLRTIVSDSAGKEVAAVSVPIQIPADSVTDIAQTLTISRPILW